MAKTENSPEAEMWTDTEAKSGTLHMITGIETVGTEIEAVKGWFKSLQPCLWDVHMVELCTFNSNIARPAADSLSGSKCLSMCHHYTGARDCN